MAVLQTIRVSAAYAEVDIDATEPRFVEPPREALARFGPTLPERSKLRFTRLDVDDAKAVFIVDKEGPRLLVGM